MIYRGGMLVGKGCYWNPMDGRRIDMKEDGLLPGEKDKTYLRVSPFCLLLIAPALGMTFVLLLPLFGVGVFIILGLIPILGALTSIAVTGMKICSRFDGKGFSFNWSPSRAGFSGAKKRRKIAGGKKRRADRSSNN